MTPFDYINNVSADKNSIWDSATSESDYNSFMINRGLSQYRDTILFAQVMNQSGQFVSKEMQYDFYRLAITNKKKRFTKWAKADKMLEIEKLALHFGINKRTMDNYVSLMNEADYSTLLKTLERGGRHGTKQN